jgi:hypothetical protein
VTWALGVTALRPDVLCERHKSLVRSMTSPAPIASNALAYRSRRSLDSATKNSAKSSSRSSSFSAYISFSMKARCRSIDVWAKASRSVVSGGWSDALCGVSDALCGVSDALCSVDTECSDVCDTELFPTPDGVVRPSLSSPECNGGVGSALAGKDAEAF